MNELLIFIEQKVKQKKEQIEQNQPLLVRHKRAELEVIIDKKVLLENRNAEIKERINNIVIADINEPSCFRELESENEITLITQNLKNELNELEKKYIALSIELNNINNLLFAWRKEKTAEIEKEVEIVAQMGDTKETSTLCNEKIKKCEKNLEYAKSKYTNLYEVFSKINEDVVLQSNDQIKKKAWKITKTS